MIRISADSTCDLSPEILNKYNIAISPLNIVLDNTVYQDNVNIRPSDVVRFFEQDNKLCRTSSINVVEYQQHFEKLLKDSSHILHFSLSSDFSSCYQNAVVAASDYPNQVYVLNTKNLSTGSGQLVVRAAEMSLSNYPIGEILSAMKNLVPKIDASFIINHLDYLAKGGRCSSLTANSAKLLKIKPTIQVQDGQMHVGKKYRGSFERSVKNYVNDRLSQVELYDSDLVFITHCLCDETIVNEVYDSVLAYNYFKKIHITHTGSTIATHCGPHTLGIGLLRK